MKRILPLAILSLFFAIAGCAAGPDDAPPESHALAQKLTHDLRAAKEAPGAESESSAELMTTGEFSNLTVEVHCNRRCIMLCGDAGDDVCAASCCEVIVR